MIDDQPPKTRKELEKKTRLDTRQNGKKITSFDQKNTKNMLKKTHKKETAQKHTKKTLKLGRWNCFFFFNPHLHLAFQVPTPQFNRTFRGFDPYAYAT